ncbi:lipopolysaccharide biosynthesis protein [Pandoraea pneumonica]|uniref:lipopolysaccharide biosynthesis protein n=1 Tax=Pandoraea pneumonica TaxID=2508299 RepID=UPI003CEB9C49
MQSYSASPNTSQGRLRRNLVRLASGTILAQVLMIAATPILTRIYNPSAFGVMAVFSSAYAIVIGFTTFKYDAAVILPRAHRNAARITLLVVILATLLSAVVAVAASALDATGLVTIPFSVAWLVCALWLGATYTLTQQWSARIANYRYYARSQVLGTVFNVGIGLLCGWLWGGTANFLILGFTAGLAVSLLYMCWEFGVWKLPRTPLKGKSMIRQAAAYRQFPLLVLPTALLTTIGTSSIPLILSANYSLGEVGAFAVANRLLLVPAALIGGALTEAFRAEFVSRVRERKSAGDLYGKTLRVLVLVAAPAFGLLALLAPMLFLHIFGVNYAASGVIGRAVALALFAQFINTPFAYVFVALRKPGIGLLAQVGTTVVPLTALAICASRGVPLTPALYVYSAITALGVLVAQIAVYRLCAHADRAIVKEGEVI